MKEPEAHAGNGPVPLHAPAGQEDQTQDFTDKHVVPAVARLHSALASCDALISRYVKRATDSENYSADAQAKFALVAARLAAAQGQTAGAIARLADAESRQRVTNIRVDDSVFRPRRRTAAGVNRAPRNNPSHGSTGTSDWENGESEDEKTTFNSSPKTAFTGPRIRQV
ncbi:MAG: hypothetical protein JSR55_01080 [Proteobacteria bacterium]|nr:hypothetical protein [Pseudomonadota bacterium]